MRALFLYFQQINYTFMSRVKGIGGIFIKSENPEKLKHWYRKHLGLEIESWGGLSFPWSDPDNSENKDYTVWSIFGKNSSYFEPSKESFMVNYVVEDLKGLLRKLKAEGVEQVGELTKEQFGKFAWIMDPEGRKIELWEPKHPA